MSDASKFKILTVCTGNICRSPLVERMLQAGLDYASPSNFHVHSAGTQAMVSEPMDSRIQSVANELGVSPQGFLARQVSDEMIQDADLVLALTKSHRSSILESVPQALHKTFTLREFARSIESVKLSKDLDVQTRWRETIKRSLRRRGRTIINPGSDDVIDPYHQSEAVLAQMINELVPATRSIVEWELKHSSAT